MIDDEKINTYIFKLELLVDTLNQMQAIVIRGGNFLSVTKNLLRSLLGTIVCTQAYIFKFKHKYKLLLPHTWVGEKPHKINLYLSDDLIEEIKKGDKIININKMNPVWNKWYEKYKYYFQSIKAKYFYPLKIHNSLLAFIVIGPKIGNLDYNEEDLMIIKILSRPIAMAYWINNLQIENKIKEMKNN